MAFSLKSVVEFDDSQLSAFGTLETGELTPVIQLDFKNGINTKQTVSTVLNSATIDVDASRLRLQSGTNSAGSAIFRSENLIKYRTGQGNLVRFTLTTDAGVVNNQRYKGAGNSIDGVFVGWNGTSWGIMHRNNSVDTWTAQASFNVDKLDGTGASKFTIDKTKLNIFQIKYPFLGAGDIRFYVQNPEDGKWIRFHIIKYANSSASVEFTNPNFYLWAANINSGNTTNVTMHIGSTSGFISGPIVYTGLPWATDNNKSGITTETCLFNVKNCTTYNGSVNRGVIRLNSVSFAVASNNGNALSVLRFKKGVTIGGTPSYSPINGTTGDNGNSLTSANAITSVDKAGTTVTNGTYIWSMNVNNAGASFIDLTPFNLLIQPSEILTVSGFSTSSAQLGATLTWTADL